MYDVITFGGATRDIFFKTTKGIIFPDPTDEQEKMLAFRYGQKIINDDATFSFGGGAFNTAVSFAKLGLKVATCINIGKDESSKSIIERLDELKIDTSYVRVDPENHTALSLIIMDKKDHVAFLHRGANNFLSFEHSDQMKNAQWFFITSLTGGSAEALPEIIKFAAENNIKVAFNPGGTQLKGGYKKLKDILSKIEMICLNREEAEELACSEDSCDLIRDNRILLHRIQKMGPKRVVITEGAKGSFYADEDIVNFEPAFTRDNIVADTTGAGDAFGSTILSCIIKGIDIPTAQKIAAINSASVTGYIGAQDGLLTLKQIESKLKEIKVVN